MAASQGMHSFNSALYWASFTANAPTLVTDITSSATWIEITDIISMSGIQMEYSVTELTHLRSPNKFKEKIPGFGDGGQITLKVDYFQSLMTALANLLPGAANAPLTYPSWGRVQWAMVFPDHGAWVCTGFLKSLPVDVPEDNRNTVDLTIEISGTPVFYPFA